LKAKDYGYISTSFGGAAILLMKTYVPRETSFSKSLLENLRKGRRKSVAKRQRRNINIHV
jgi:hypothetical protein